jgi:predicted kinase
MPSAFAVAATADGSASNPPWSCALPVRPDRRPSSDRPISQSCRLAVIGRKAATSYLHASITSWRPAVLIVFSGLPGAGKTTLAQALARSLHAGYVRIDTIEDALLAEGGSSLVDAGAGYRVAYAMAEDNLGLGRTVIADSVNPIRLTREAWRDIGRRSGSIVVDVQVICSDKTQHRHRIEARDPGTRASNWLEIVNRDFNAVDHTTIVIDTAGQTVEQSLAALQMAVSARMP